MSKRFVFRFFTFLVIILFLFSSCASRYEKPFLDYSEKKEKMIIQNSDVKDNHISAQLIMNEEVPEKAKEEWQSFSERNGSFLGTVVTIGAPILIFLYSWYLIPTAVWGDENKSETREAQALYLFPVGGPFWYPCRRIPSNNVKIETIGKKTFHLPIKDKNILVSLSNNEQDSLTVKTDKRGYAYIEIKNELYKYENITLEIKHKNHKADLNINLLDFYKKQFGFTDKEITEYKSLTPESRITYVTFASLYRNFFYELDFQKRKYIAKNYSTKDINDPWKLLAALTNVEMNVYLNPAPPEKKEPPKPPSKPVNPPFISEPKLPPVKEIKQSPFENREMFTERMEKAKEERENQIKGILESYRNEVEKRNQKIKKLNDNYKKDYEKYLARLKEYKFEQEEKIREYEIKVNELRALSQKKENEVLEYYFAKLFGNPSLKEAVNSDNSPKYDPEKEIMVANLYYGDEKNPILEQEISFSGIKAGDIAKSFYEDLKKGKINPDVKKSFSDNNLNIEKVIAKTGLFAEVTGKPLFDKFSKAKIGKVILGYKDSDRLADLKTENYQTELELTEYEMPEELSFQSANIKDVQFETYVSKELKKFNDDIPSLLKKTSENKKDPKKWLFVIGVENYKNTNKINFSSRSAEMFADVAVKTFGIPEYNSFLLIDNGIAKLSSLNKNRIYSNTAGSIKDQLRYLIRDVKKGDKIYFYYSGHGIPSVNDDKKPYILAKDQAPDFIHEEKFFCVDEIYNQLAKSRADEILVFMDSCFTGETDGSSVYLGDKASTRLAPKDVSFDSDKMAVMCAGNKNQFSNMYKEKGHRMFSYYVMKSILNGSSTIEDLYNKVYVNTKSTSRKLGGSNLQEPTLKGNIGLSLK